MLAGIEQVGWEHRICVDILIEPSVTALLGSNMEPHTSMRVSCDVGLLSMTEFAQWHLVY